MHCRFIFTIPHILGVLTDICLVNEMRLNHTVPYLSSGFLRALCEVICHDYRSVAQLHEVIHSKPLLIWGMAASWAKVARVSTK